MGQEKLVVLKKNSAKYLVVLKQNIIWKQWPSECHLQSDSEDDFHSGCPNFGQCYQSFAEYQMQSSRCISEITRCDIS